MTRLRPHLLTLTSVPLILLIFPRQPTLGCVKAVSSNYFLQTGYWFPALTLDKYWANIRCVVEWRQLLPKCLVCNVKRMEKKNALYAARMFDRPKGLSKGVLLLTTKGHRVTMKTVVCLCLCMRACFCVRVCVCVWRSDLRLGISEIRGAVMWTQKRWGKL